MSEPVPIDVVRSRYPFAPDQDEAGLREHAEELERRRSSLGTEDLRGIEIAVTFDPRRSGSNG